MFRISSVLTCVCFAAIGCTGLATAAQADKYPTKTIQMIVPYPPGGPSDMIGRTIAEGLSATLGQKVIVENHPGAGGDIGAAEVARAPADGYTLLTGGAGTLTVHPTLRKGKLQFDPLKDFVPLSLIAKLPLMLVVNPSLPVHNVKELIQLAKSRPGKLNYASPGIGTPSNLAGELLKKLAGVKIVHVPYKGGAAASVDLIAGRVQMMFNNMSVSLPHVKAGQVRALAVTSAKRSPMIPDVPTMSEAGVPGFAIVGWWGVLVRSGTPQPIVDELSKKIQQVVRTPEVQKKLLKFGFMPVGSDSEQLEKFMRSETQKWKEVMSEAGMLK